MTICGCDNVWYQGHMQLQSWSYSWSLLVPRWSLSVSWVSLCTPATGRAWLYCPAHSSHLECAEQPLETQLQLIPVFTVKKKNWKTLKCFFYNLITCWDPCFFTTWALRSRLRFSYVISSNIVVGVAQLAAQENGAREDYLQHGLQKDLHLVRVYSGRSSYLWASVWTKHGHSMGEN